MTFACSAAFITTGNQYSAESGKAERWFLPNREKQGLNRDGADSISHPDVAKGD
jgi:hypothetical protein